MKLLKSGLVSALALGCAMTIGSAAVAESFTFTSTGEVTGGIAVPMADGSEVTAGTSAGTTKWKWVSGGKMTTTYACHTMSQRPGSMFDLHGVCDISEGDTVTSSVLFGCNFLDAEKTTSNCVGGLVGKAGDYEGKSGTISWNGSPTGSTGAGHWND